MILPVEDVSKSHIYTIDWKRDSIVWLVDGKPLRTLFRANATSTMVC
jgi:beta-glucanase (GH16 family)